jgi:hypothetical protein
MHGEKASIAHMAKERENGAHGEGNMPSIQMRSRM